MHFKITKFPFFVFILLGFLSFAQQSANEFSFKHKIDELFFHNTKSTPLVISNKTLYALKPNDQSISWEKPMRNFFESITNVNGIPNYIELPDSKFVILGGKHLVNIENGETLLSASLEHNEIAIHEYLPAYNAYFLAFTNTILKTTFDCYLIDNNTGEILFNHKLKGNGPVTFLDVVNSKLIVAKGDMIYQIQNDSLQQLGETQHYASLFLNPNKDALIGITAKSKLQASLAKADEIKYGNEIRTIPLSENSTTWENSIAQKQAITSLQHVSDSSFLVTSKNYTSLFSYQDGLAVWEAPYKTNYISETKINPEGILIHKKSRKMQLDWQGKEAWKRTKKLVEGVDINLPEKETYVQLIYETGLLVVFETRIEFYKKGMGKQWTLPMDENTFVAFDEARKNFVLLNKEKLYILNPDNDLSKKPRTTFNLQSKESIHVVEIRDNGYFFRNQSEFVVTDFNGQVQQQGYFKPIKDGWRKAWNGSSSLVLNMVYAYRMYSGITGTLKGGKKVVTGLMLMNPIKFIKGIKKVKSGIETIQKAQETEELRKDIQIAMVDRAKASNNYTFFVTREESTNVLKQVHKDSGSVENTYVVDQKDPNYQVDTKNGMLYFVKEKSISFTSFLPQRIITEGK